MASLITLSHQCQALLPASHTCALSFQELLPGSMRLSAALSATILGLLFAPALVPVRAWLRRQEGGELEARNLLEDGRGNTAEGQKDTEEGHALPKPGPGGSRFGVDTHDSHSTEPRAEALSMEGESAGGGAPLLERARPVRGADHTLGQAVQGADFWLLCVSQIIGAGCGLTAINK